MSSTRRNAPLSFAGGVTGSSAVLRFRNHLGADYEDVKVQDIEDDPYAAIQMEVNSHRNKLRPQQTT